MGNLLKVTSRQAASHKFVTLGYRVPMNLSADKAQTSEQIRDLLRGMRRHALETDPTVEYIGDKLFVVGTPEDHDHVQKMLGVLVQR